MSKETPTVYYTSKLQNNHHVALQVEDTHSHNHGPYALLGVLLVDTYLKSVGWNLVTTAVMV
jgi:hypothetical protein